MHAWRNVGVIANSIVVIDSAAGVENDIGANDSARINNHTRANRRAGADANIWCNHCLGVPSNDEALALPTQSIEQVPTRAIIADRNHDRSVGDLSEIGHPAQNRQAKQRLVLHSRCIIQIAQRCDLRARVTHTHEHIRQHLPVAAGAKNQYAFHYTRLPLYSSAVA
jgi:hypothetical protein